MEGRERDCEKLRKRETIRETKQGLRWQQRRKHGDPQRREVGRESCRQHGGGSPELGVWPASHHPLTSNSLHRGTKSMEANSSLGSTPHL